MSLKILCKFFLSFPAYHLQKSHFKIFDVSLIYSGSHFGATAYFKMTGLKDPVFLLSPLNFPKGIPAQLTFFITTIALQSNSWQPTDCAFQWSSLTASPKLTCGTLARRVSFWNYQGENYGFQSLKKCRLHFSIFQWFNVYHLPWFLNKLDMDASIIKI